MTAPVRVRIAPSPTGNLHVGTARTALFNYLFAKRHGGQFILRVEDTDLERSEERFITDIYDGLKLLGLQWDEGPDCGGDYGPYVQSERLALYQQYAEQLLASGHAYHCYCTQAELDAEKQQAVANKQPYVYSRRCLQPGIAEQLKQDTIRKSVVRFRIPDAPEQVIWPDAVRGDVSFETKLMGDFVLVKSNGVASYNFAVVIDDVTMAISHVIRGEDHIPNTPKQILLYQALGKPCPTFAHVGMILAPDRSKLSKRHGATAVSEFIRQGYLPEAFGNFLALLGWSPTDGEEIASLTHFAQQFSLERIAHSPAIFDMEKLQWMNGMYLRQMPLPELWNKTKPFLPDATTQAYADEQWCAILDAVREPLTTLSEIPEAVSYFVGQAVSYDEQVQTEVLAVPETQMILQQFNQDVLPDLDFASPDALAAGVKNFANSLKPLKMKTVMWAIRGAVTGRVHGADLGKTLSILGRETVQYRVQAALTQLASTPVV